MKIVEAIVQPFKLDEVKEALHGIAVEGIAMSEVRFASVTMSDLKRRCNAYKVDSKF